MKMDPATPFNDLPALPPKADLESKQVLRQVVKARTALAEMKGMGLAIPNQAMLINTLTIREAKDSSEIENIITTQDELYIAFATQRKSISPQVNEVLNYREALWHGYNHAKEKGILTTNDLCEIQGVIIENNAGIRTEAGTVLKNAASGEVIYTPPTGEDTLRRMLGNLEEYINTDNDEVDPLIKMAIVHYQFESIHPFYDGNGRTGRILNILYLVLKGLLDIPILYLSSHIIKTKSDYYRLLGDVRKTGNWEDWIMYMLNGIEETAIKTSKLMQDIKEVFDMTIRRVKQEAPNIYSKDLVEALFEQPYCKAAFLVEKGLYERRTAMKHLRHLEHLGILKGMVRGKQNLFINIELYNLMSMHKP